MSQIDRAVEVMKRLEILVPEHQFRAALRAYQAPREWTVEELDALPDGTRLMAENGDVHPHWWWAGEEKEGWQPGPLRLVFNPDDVEEDTDD